MESKSGYINIEWLLLLCFPADPSCQFCLACLVLSTGLLLDFLDSFWKLEVNLLGLLSVDSLGTGKFQTHLDFSVGQEVVINLMLCFLALFLFSSSRVPNQYASLFTPVRICLWLSTAQGLWVYLAGKSRGR